MALLSVQNLSLNFLNENTLIPALKNISFDLEKGKCLGIVGESGSGKSVCSLTIMGLLDKKIIDIPNGKILYRQKNLLALSEKELREIRGIEISMIFQEPMSSLNPVMTCGAQVLESILLHQKVDKEEGKSRVVQLFKEVLLPRPENIFDSYPHQLSGGQKQRVMIAMALSSNPQIIIADEPTTALDVTVQKSILELLIKIQKDRQMSLIFISHDLGVISEIADSILVMYKGEVVEIQDKESLFKNPKMPYTKGLLACRPDLNLHLKRLPTISNFTEHPDKKIEEIINPYKVSESEALERNYSIENASDLLRVENLKVYFPITQGLFGQGKEFVKAVDDVSFSIKKGETIGLVGESGCGKSTLGRAILQLVKITAGRVLFDNENLCSLSPKQMHPYRADLQLIFQDPFSSMNPSITIGKAVEEPLLVHFPDLSSKERKEKSIELLRKVGIAEDQYHKYPREFSGGQRQRICIARTLIMNPKFIICDESVSALDVSVQAQVLNLLCDLRDEFNLTLLFISHDLSVVKHLSDKIIIMNKGKIEEMAKPDEIYLRPKSTYTKSLIESIPVIKV